MNVNINFNRVWNLNGEKSLNEWMNKIVIIISSTHVAYEMNTDDTDNTMRFHSRLNDHLNTNISWTAITCWRRAKRTQHTNKTEARNDNNNDDGDDDVMILKHHDDKIQCLFNENLNWKACIIHKIREEIWKIYKKAFVNNNNNKKLKEYT